MQPDHAICITNPPYSYRPRRGMGIARDTYIVALRRCLAAFHYVVAIIPERFLTSDFMLAQRLDLIDVIEADIFLDTPFPACVACWGPSQTDDVQVFKNGRLIAARRELMACLPVVELPGIRFGDVRGQIGLITYDDDENSIRFCPPGWVLMRRRASRHRTRIHVSHDLDPTGLMGEANRVLNLLRRNTADLVLHPYLKNNTAGIRRRRLTFSLARRIISQAILALRC